ncbi:MAG: hypothetical protein PHV34_17205 [Verrucomicrobiae bacterium]|nr:hypothetical protein [Verrucomicrobiae bacterium]
MKKSAIRQPSPAWELLRRLLAIDGWSCQMSGSTALQAKKGKSAVLFKALGDTANRPPPSSAGVMIAPDENRLQHSLLPQNAGKLPGWLRLSTDELVQLAARRIPDRLPALGIDPLKIDTQTPHAHHQWLIDHFTVTVKSNLPVGRPAGNQFKLRFQTAHLRGITPGQFIMLQTRPGGPVLKSRPFTWNKAGRTLDLAPKAFLKRPFGIHRAFFPGFAPDFLRTLSLPSTLAAIIHPPQADEYDIFYKALDGGIGTHELRQLKPGDKIQALGPLGNPFDPASLRARGIEEIHLIGGGMGMAPLTFMAQHLRLHGFRIKAFVGLFNLAAIRLSDTDQWHNQTAASGHLFLDDLAAIGVKPEDLFVSEENKTRPPAGLPLHPKNFSAGFVTRQYERWVDAQHPASRRAQPPVMAFACGPIPMMRGVWQTCQARKIPLKVLMEKRMACGMGVCFSCVCRAKTAEGTERYSRVCLDGPIYDAQNLIW